ncbi:cyclin-dependent kinase-like 5, partial [Mugil cephalus]|uniref:cyclin-dependent kinase-like 5 n=1 Tax=Mugil cephalus TaxID=48193 RepID=UPI001FB5BEC9
MERYESLGPVGEGSYGTVLKCRHRDSGRLVAIKKFMDSDDDKTVKKIALREIKLLRQLRHDNLVNLLEVWKRRRRWYLVFEFVERTLLDDLEQSPGGLDLNTSRQYLYQILRAAAFCHKQNIIHRDIKPENILISQGGVVKLCDFGFARTMASPSEGAVYTDYVATRWYRAPELLVGDIKYGKPVDVWAVGCLLIEMLTGQPLFPGDSDLDQIYHIVRCFGNLTSHHQELFYRNPIFSGVRLPECSGRVMLQQRFPTITSTALDLAQSCLEMDPEKRAQCSELLEHPLFTQDSFHIRFLDELNAKIQKDHRENSTLPKITKTENNPKQEKDDEKNRRGKDKKHPEDADEKVGKEKLEKNKGKQQLKVSKTVSNKSEPLMTTKQPKTLGNKVVYNAAQPSMQMKSKPGKTTGVELLSKSIKILHLHSSEGTKTAVSLKDDNTEEAIPKHERVVSLEPRDEYLDHAKDIEHNGSELWRLSKSEQSQDCGNNTNTIMSSSPDASIDRTDRHYSSSNNHVDVIVPTFISKPSKSSNTSEPQTHSLTAESQQRTGECPKVLSADHKLSKTLSTSHPITNKSNLCSSATPSKIISAQSSTLSIEVTPANSTMTVAEEISDPKLSKVGSPSKGRPKDLIEVAEDEHIKDSHICLRMSPETKMALHHVQTSQASGEHDKMNLESSEPRCLHQESPTRSKIATEARTTSVQKENTSVGNPNLKTLKVSDKENRQDLALFVPISATAKSSVNQTSKKASGNDIKSSNFESGVKFVKAVHPKSLAGEPKSKPEYYYTRSTTTPRTQ